MPRALQAAGRPVSPTELSELLPRSTGGITQILDRLERGALVRRADDPGDRRRGLVALTARGQRVARDAGAAYAGERDRILGPLSPAEVRRPDVAVRRLLELLTGEAGEP